MGLVFHMEFYSHFGAILAPFGNHFGSISGPKMLPNGPQWLLDGPKWPQNGTQRVKIAPKGLFNGRRCLEWLRDGCPKPPQWPLFLKIALRCFKTVAHLPQRSSNPQCEAAVGRRVREWKALRLYTSNDSLERVCKFFSCLMVILAHAGRLALLVTLLQVYVSSSYAL